MLELIANMKLKLVPEQQPIRLLHTLIHLTHQWEYFCTISNNRKGFVLQMTGHKKFDRFT